MAKTKKEKKEKKAGKRMKKKELDKMLLLVLLMLLELYTQRVLLTAKILQVVEQKLTLIKLTLIATE